jgi:hypothetical protein
MLTFVGVLAQVLCSLSSLGHDPVPELRGVWVGLRRTRRVLGLGEDISSGPPHYSFSAFISTFFYMVKENT